MMIASLVAVVLLHASHQMLIAGLILVLAMPFGGVGALALLFQLRVDNRVPMIVLTLRSVLWGAAVLVIYLEHGGMVALAIAMVATNIDRLDRAGARGAEAGRRDGPAPRSSVLRRCSSRSACRSGVAGRC